MPTPQDAIDAQGSAQARLADQLATLITGRDTTAESFVVLVDHDDLSVDVHEDVEGPLTLADDREPALILVWIESMVASRLDGVERLTRRFPDAPLVVACPGIERWEVRAALTAGAAGVVLLSDLDDALDPCLRAVRAGQTCVPRAHWQQIEPPALSAREKQILGLVVMGYMNGQIAEQLFLAESTVKSHLSSAFGKLGVRSRNEAVNLILNPERGLGMGILGLGATPVDSPQELR